MKELLLTLLLTTTLIGFSQDKNYAGNWSTSGENFENEMTLEKIEAKENSYKFSFFGWRNSYDSFTKQVIKFPGEMTDEVFTIEIKNNSARYNDDVQVFEQGWSLYNEGEKKCNVYFQFNKNEILVKTEDCHLIYGGFGVFFDGVYKKKK